jgi:hypothetical protein
MAKTFVSYSRKSEAAAKALVADLENLGHTPWFDQDLSGGQAWWDQILATIRGCDIFVFVLDPDSLASTACQREYGYAADLKKPIVPVLVSGDVSLALLPPALSQIQLVDYRGEDRTAAFRLARAVSQVPPAGPLPDPLPDPPAVPLSYLGTLAAQVDGTSTLSYEHQSALLLDLKAQLRDPGTADDARLLLDRLRRRRDLLAAVGDEITVLLASAPSAPALRPVLQQPGVAVTVADAAPAATSDGGPRSTLWDYRRVSPRERIASAFTSAAIVVVLGILAPGGDRDLAAYLVVGAVAGLVPGAIVGPRAWYALLACGGAILGAVVLISIAPGADDTIVAAAVVAAPIGATLVGILGLTLRKR